MCIRDSIGDLKEARYISKAIPLLRKNAACCRQAEQRLRIYDPYQVRAELPDLSLIHISTREARRRETGIILIPLSLM